MNDNNNRVDIHKAVVCGLEVLDNANTHIPGNKVEDISIFKGVLRSILQGQLVLATPDRLIKDEKPKDDVEVT